MSVEERLEKLEKLTEKQTEKQRQWLLERVGLIQQSVKKWSKS